MDRNALMAELTDVSGSWLNGVLRRDPGNAAQTLAPATEEPLLTYSYAGREEIEGAIPAVRAAADGWSRVGLAERQRTLRDLLRALDQRRDDLALLDALDAGLPIATAQADVDQALEKLRLCLAWVYEVDGRTPPAPDGSHRAMTQRAPYGIVGVIVPYNHPAKFGLGKVVPALVTGNAVLLKPSDYTPLSAMLMGSIAAGCLPPGVLNVLPGSADVGRAITEHPDVNRVSFTGSTSIGQRVASTVSHRLGSLHLELGGKNSTVVLPGADLEAAANAAIVGMDLQRSAGQACWALSRIFVHERVADPFLAKVAQRLNPIRPADPTSAADGIGPVATAEARKGYVRYREVAHREAVELWTPESWEQPAVGYYCEPLMVEVRGRSVLLDDEIFAPILTVRRAETVGSLVEAANAGDYGLSAAVWSGDLGEAWQVAEELRAGYVWLNSAPIKPAGLPFGPWGKSGYGKENCLEELRDCTREKSVVLGLQ